MSRRVAESREVTLLELLDRVIDQGVVLDGDITISVADVDLIYLGLKLMLAPVERLEEYRASLEHTSRHGATDV
jgi:gas vesicle structural protein